jgi:cell division protease FtsH
MVKEYGMSRQLGQVYFAPKRQGQFLNPNQDGGGEYSEMTSHMIDKEIRRIIDEQYEMALNILKSNRELLDQTAKKLLETEIIEGPELQALQHAVSKNSIPKEKHNSSKEDNALAA